MVGDSSTSEMYLLSYEGRVDKKGGGKPGWVTSKNGYDPGSTDPIFNLIKNV